jgi:hypothetical protein
MPEATRIRLDNVDLAVGEGWQVDSTTQADVFARGGVVIEVQYTTSDDIDDMVKTGAIGVREPVVHERVEPVEVLRTWLTGRSHTDERAVDLPPAEWDRYKDGWTRDEFVGAVEDPQDQAFLRRFLRLVDANGQSPKQGSQPRLFFGSRPKGGMFVYPFGRRHPPYQLLVGGGRLAIAGCWSRFPEVKGHSGFAELAQLLDLDEKGPASRVPVEGLDPDEVWEVGELASRAINT